MTLVSNAFRGCSITKSLFIFVVNVALSDKRAVSLGNVYCYWSFSYEQFCYVMWKVFIALHTRARVKFVC